jgi:hypothetical protein
MWGKNNLHSTKKKIDPNLLTSRGKNKKIQKVEIGDGYKGLTLG